MGASHSVTTVEVMEGPAEKRQKVASDHKGPLPHVLTRTLKVAGQPTSPREDGQRSVRPRPLHVAEQVRVVWEGDPDWEELDGGAFAQWMQNSEEQLQRHARSSKAPVSSKSQVTVIGHSFKLLQEDCVSHLSHAEHSLPAGHKRAADGDGDVHDISVPRSRQLHSPPRSKNGGIWGTGVEEAGKGRYVRYVAQDGDSAEGRVEYDMDEEDEEWLGRHNKRARAVDRLSEDAFEGLMDHFAKALQTALQQRTDLWPAAVGQAFEASDIDRILPLEQALQAEEATHASRAAAAAVYDHWRTRRVAAQRPLLQRLCFEQPWVGAREAVGTKEAWGPGSSTKGGAGGGGGGNATEELLQLGARSGGAEPEPNLAVVPFMGRESARPVTRPRRMDVEDAQYKLESIREDLETIRTMADQMRRREKAAKRELLIRRQGVRQRLGATGGGNKASAAAALASQQEGSGASSGKLAADPASLPPDREARHAMKAANQAARAAATLIGAQVVLLAAETKLSRAATLPAAAAGPAAGGAAPFALEAGPTSSSLPAPLAPQQPAGPHRLGECFWCAKEGTVLGCGACPRGFCFACYKHRPGYGIVNWGRAARDPAFTCPVCTGREPASTQGDSAAGADAAPRGMTMGQVPPRAGHKQRRRESGLSFLRGRGRRSRSGRAGCGRGRPVVRRPERHPPADEPPLAPATGDAEELPHFSAAATAAAAEGDQQAAQQQQAQSGADAALQQERRDAARRRRAAKLAVALAQRPRDGLRHARQNYEKLAGMRRSRGRAQHHPRDSINNSNDTYPVGGRRFASLRTQQQQQRRVPPTGAAAAAGKRPRVSPAWAVDAAAEEDSEDDGSQKQRQQQQRDERAADQQLRRPARPGLAVRVRPRAAQAARLVETAKRSARRTRALVLRSLGQRPIQPGGGSEEARKPAAGAAAASAARAQPATKAGQLRKPQAAGSRGAGGKPGAAKSGSAPTLVATGVPGVQRVHRRSGQPRRSARVEYAVSCGGHPSYRLDRVARLVEYFGQHAACRPEWAALGRQPGERAASYEQRLKGTFSFSSAATLCAPHARVTILAAKPPAAAKLGSTKPAGKPPSAPLAAMTKGALTAACHAEQKLPACDMAAAAAASAAAAGGKLPGSRKRAGAPLRAALLARHNAAAGVPCSAASSAGGVRKQLQGQPQRPGASLLSRSSAAHGGCSKCRHKPGGCAACNIGFSTKQLQAQPGATLGASAHGQHVGVRRKRA